MVIEWIAKRLGELHAVYLTGDIAEGKDSKLIDLVLIGSIDQGYLLTLIEKAEKLIQRKIRYLVYSDVEFGEIQAGKEGMLLVWASDTKHSDK